MGEVIKIDTVGQTRALTETGEGGFLSAGYLRDAPAASYLDDVETPVFALTNAKRGITIERGDEADRVRSGDGYRTIAMLTDRRLLALVGASTTETVEGDQRIAVPLVEIEGVDVTGGRRNRGLTLRGAGGTEWTVHAGGDLAAAAAYARAASRTWIHVENTLDTVKRHLVAATSHRDEGDYDAALESVDAADDALAEARRSVETFAEDWPAGSLTRRVERTSERHRGTVAEVRVGRARALSDEAESLWREAAHEDAHEAYCESLREYDAALSIDAADVADRTRVEAEAERVERSLERLSRAPLNAAVEADEAAQAADDPDAAADHWATAIERYRTVLELDWGADERRFAGDPDDVRERLETVVQRLVSARRSAAKEAQRAGDWHRGADQEALAIEEFERAREQFQRALDVARNLYPAAVDHLEADLAAVEETIERIESDDPMPDKRADADDHEVAAAIGEAGDDADGIEDDGGARSADRSLAERIRALDEAAFCDLVVDVLQETGWETERGPAEADVLARKETPAGETMAVNVVHPAADDPVGAAAVDESADLRQSVPEADVAMLATSRAVTEQGTRNARRRQVRLLDDECLTTVIEARDLAEELLAPRIEE